jgi:hypothetical protein
MAVRVLIVGLAAFLAGCAYLGAGDSPGPSVGSVASPTTSQTSPTEPAISPDSSATAGATPVPTQSELPAPASTEAATPAATGTPTETATPTAAATPTASEELSNLEASDRFWNYFFGTCFFGVDDDPTLRSMFNESVAVIRGPIAGVTVVDEVGSDVVSLTVMPGEVLKGPLNTRADGTIEVRLGSDLDPPADHMRMFPAHDNLWFLWTDTSSGTYWDADYAQTSIIRDIDGVVRVIRPRLVAEAFSASAFPVRFEGTSFEELVERVRVLAGSSQRLLPGQLQEREAHARTFAC